MMIVQPVSWWPLAPIECSALRWHVWLVCCLTTGSAAGAGHPLCWYRLVRLFLTQPWTRDKKKRRLLLNCRKISNLWHTLVAMCKRIETKKSHKKCDVWNGTMVKWLNISIRKSSILKYNFNSKLWRKNLKSISYPSKTAL